MLRLRSIDDLIEGEEAPDAARASIQTHKASTVTSL